MPQEPLTPGYIQETFRRLRRIQQATQIQGQPTGGVTLNYNLDAGLVNGTFIFPIRQEDDGENLVMKVVDFAE